MQSEARIISVEVIIHHTGINMHEYYQQLWYFKNEEGICYRYIPLVVGHCDWHPFIWNMFKIGTYLI